MKILLLQIDKTQDSYIIEGIEIYTKRLKNYTTFEIATINVPKAVRQRVFNPLTGGLETLGGED